MQLSCPKFSFNYFKKEFEIYLYYKIKIFFHDIDDNILNEEEIAVVIDDEDITHYTVKCPFCGEEIMLCGLCRMDFGAVDCEDDENGCIVCR